MGCTGVVGRMGRMSFVGHCHPTGVSWIQINVATCNTGDERPESGISCVCSKGEAGGTEPSLEGRRAAWKISHHEELQHLVPVCQPHRAQKTAVAQATWPTRQQRLGEGDGDIS